MTTIRKYIASVVDVRKGEALITLLMFAFYYIILVTYYLLKPARDSLFLVKLGAAQLPVVFIITALFIAPITTMYSAASRSLKLTRLIYVTSAILAVNLLLLRWLLTYDEGWVFYLFYVWVSIYGALTASQFWLFANAVFTPAQGKRLFALLNLGGILGAMTGGEVTSMLVRALGIRTENLLFVCVALVSSFGLFARAAWKLYAKDAGETTTRRRASAKREQRETVGQMFTMIKSSRHLLYLVGIIALTMATASFVDYQFKTVSAQAFPETARLTSFLGVFYSRLSLVSLILQVVFAYRVVRLVGVAGVVMFLPLGLLLGSAYMLFVPGLVAGVLLRGASGAFTYSLDKTGRELLFLPVPLEVKKRTKVFIDMFVDRWSRGVAGGALLLFTAVLGFGVREISVVVLVLVAVWLVLVFLIRKEYVGAFRSALARRQLDPGQLAVNITDGSTLSMLRDLLGSDHEREVVYALDILRGSSDRSLVPELHRLLLHPSDEVKRLALEHLRDAGVEPDAGAAGPLVRHPDPALRLAAMQALAPHGDGDERLRGWIADRDPRVAATALRVAAAQRREAMLARERVEELAVTPGEGGAGVRLEVARALGALRDDGYAGVLRRLARDDDAAVAGGAVEAMGATRDREFVPELLAMLGESSRRTHARAALVSFGNSVVGTLGDYLADDATEVLVRSHIPAVLSRIPTQASADALAAALGNVDASLRFRVVKALNKLRRNYPDLVIAHQSVDAAFVDETKMYYEVLQIENVCRGIANSPNTSLLQRALAERLEHNLERVFRVLGLHYPPNDIYNAYLGIVSSDRDRRSSAVEFLDNVLGKNLKKYLFPIIDQVSEAVTIQRGRDLFGLDIAGRDSAVLALIRGRDPWLRACAIYCCAGSDDDEVRRAVEQARNDNDPLVRETAERVLRGDQRKERTQMFTVIEKVIFLQNVDVFSDVPTESLAYLAAIAEEVTYMRGETVYETGEASDSLYLVLDGAVRLHRDGDDIMVAGPNDAFGTWALFDDEPRVATATADEESRLLRIDREDFLELLSDHSEITQGVFKNIVGRLRGLVGRVTPR